MTPVSFFYQQAGYSYRPGTETPSQGRRRCARALAAAERKASRAGFSFAWSIDPDASSLDWDESGVEPWALWQCVCLNMKGDAIASLHAIDFSADGEPWSDPYRRVVEAELAMEALS